MIEPQQIELSETVPADVMNAWREDRKRVLVVGNNIPSKVTEFIEAIASELGDFEQDGKYVVLISGYELELANIKDIGGERIVRHALYPIDVPIMKAVDHRTAMRKLYSKYGNPGVVSYLKEKCDPKRIRALVEILNMHVANG
jgi:PHP family Zn ribbon phosphoesterase